MKRTIKFLTLALCPVVFAISCEREMNIVEENSPEVKMVTVSCTLPSSEDPESKVTLVNDGTKGKTSWVNGDEVFFHGKKVGSGNSCVAAAHDVSADGKTAYFTIPVLSNLYDGGTSYISSMFAAYPASAVAEYSEGVSWYYISAFKNTNTLLLAGCNDFTGDEYSFKFFNLTGALSFMVDGSSFGGFDKYVFEGNNEETIGWDKHSVAFATLKTTGVVEERYRYKGSSGPGASSGPKTVITVTPAAGWDNGTTVNTIYFPGTGEYDKAAANFTGGFTIKFYKDDVEVKRVKTTAARNITVGKLLDLGDITSHLFTYVPPAKHDSSIGLPADGSDYDLSKTASANCYIVDGSVAANANKVFKFKAYRGKGTTDVGKINSVQVLWATYNTGTAPEGTTDLIAAVDYDKQTENDYYEICFKTPETLKAGNALIAAKDEFGTILWSWHIWIPATSIGSGNYGVSTPEMMDRNLGALVVAGSGDIRANGLLYQWGRKDPFVSQAAHGSSTIASVVGSAKTVSDVELSIAESIANPTVFSKAVTGDKYYWIAPGDYTLWGTTKTSYDPCPPGWRVVHPDESTLFTTDVTQIAGYSYDSANYCVTIGTAIFPLAGRLHYSNGNVNDRDTVMKLWSAKCSPNGLARWLSVSGASEYNTWDERSANACSVRCVAE